MSKKKKNYKVVVSCHDAVGKDGEFRNPTKSDLIRVTNLINYLIEKDGGDFMISKMTKKQRSRFMTKDGFVPGFIEAHLEESD